MNSFLVFYFLITSPHLTTQYVAYALKNIIPRNSAYSESNCHMLVQTKLQRI